MIIQLILFIKNFKFKIDKLLVKIEFLFNVLLSKLQKIYHKLDILFKLIKRGFKIHLKIL